MVVEVDEAVEQNYVRKHALEQAQILGVEVQEAATSYLYFLLWAWVGWVRPHSPNMYSMTKELKVNLILKFGSMFHKNLMFSMYQELLKHNYWFN